MGAEGCKGKLGAASKPARRTLVRPCARGAYCSFDTPLFQAANISSAEGISSGRMMRKPSHLASVWYQMLLGSCGSWAFQAASEPRRKALSERPRDLAAWLKPLGATVEQLRWHCGAVWFKKTGSLKLVAEKLNISYGWAHWHYNRMKTGKVELGVGEL